MVTHLQLKNVANVSLYQLLKVATPYLQVPKPPRGLPKLVYAMALYEYTAQEEGGNELSFIEGDIIGIRDQDPSGGGWWKGALFGGSKCGYLPANYVNELQYEWEEDVLTPKRGATVQALYDFAPENDYDLGLKAGDTITVIETSPDGWWLGYSNGKTGYFPVNYTTQH